MPTPPRRKRFQIHLSTAIVMMFVAGGLIWVNVRARAVEAWQLNPIDGGEVGDIYFGWPLTGAVSRWNEYAFPGFQQREMFFPYAFCAIDLIVGSFILLAVWFFCEWLIRRRAARKGA